MYFFILRYFQPSQPTVQRLGSHNSLVKRGPTEEKEIGGKNRLRFESSLYGIQESRFANGCESKQRKTPCVRGAWIEDGGCKAGGCAAIL